MKLQKHQYFWLGVFASLLLALPIVGGIVATANERAQDWVTFLFGVAAALIIVLVVIAILRDRILKFLRLSVEPSLNDFVSSLSQTIAYSATGRADDAAKEAGNAAGGLIAWYTWSNFYRWVIATSVGLIIAIGGFAGTVLLIEQNAKLSEQSEIMTIQTEMAGIDLTTKIRELLSSGGSTTVAVNKILRRQKMDLDELRDDLELAMEQKKFCVMLYKEITLEKLPLRSKLDEVLQLAKHPNLKDRIAELLRSLISDKNAQSLAAIILLTELEQSLPELPDEFAAIRNVYIDRPIHINSSELLMLKVQQSVFDEVTCSNCEIDFSDSLLLNFLPQDTYAENSLSVPHVFGQSAVAADSDSQPGYVEVTVDVTRASRNHVSLIEAGSVKEPEDQIVEFELEPVGAGYASLIVDMDEDVDAEFLSSCSDIEELCANSSFYECWEPTSDELMKFLESESS